jgi:ribonucleoside-diphosphate reductase alpha chain
MEPISQQIWQTKYRYRAGDGVGEQTIADTWRRVARAIAAVEPRDRAHWEQKFFDLLQDFKFLPGGRILAGAGTGRSVTLFNCFVMGLIEDSLPGILRALSEGALTQQQGGGVGYDFSTLRPKGMRAKGVGAIASGPVSFMLLWDAVAETLMSTGPRRAAMMASLRCDHPDIEAFVAAKREPGRLRYFNLSVQVTDAFMAAVSGDAEWQLIFPATSPGEGALVERAWPGYAAPVACRVVRTLPARALWEAILRSAYETAEPGVLFVDRINAMNNLWYREAITTTNPCGEVPLPPYGACDLGSINLTRFVKAPFTAGARLDAPSLAATVETAARFLDNVIDASRFPLPQHEQNARGSRRIGLGVTGLADALVMLGLRYDDGRAVAWATQVMRQVCHAAYNASIALAREKGPFRFFERDKYLEGAFVRALPQTMQAAIAEHGIRNSHLTAIAPTGSISLLAGNVSSGIEPVFAASYCRSILDETGSAGDFELTDYAVRLWRRSGPAGEDLPPAFVSARELPVSAHLDMQAALQQHVDNAISKTVNVAEGCSFEEFRRIYATAYDKGLKGCTAYRPNPVRGAVLTGGAAAADAPHCCVLEREPD